MDVLMHLASRPDGCATHDELLRAFWRGALSSTNAVHKCIAELRRAFGDDSRAPSYIETIPKRGYRLIASVRQFEARHQPTDAPTRVLAAAAGCRAQTPINQLMIALGDDSLAKPPNRSQHLSNR